MSTKILCADDDRGFCRTLARTFQEEGYEVLIAHDGASALELHQEHRPALSILSVLLPRRDGFAVLELRGGTHLVLLPSEEPASGEAYFDLMVEDIDAAHAELRGKGLEPSEIQPGKIHRSFTLASPSGHMLKFNSTHVSDLPV